MDDKLKGELGEQFVYEYTYNVLRDYEIDNRIMKNARFLFQSVYGRNGYISAEIDLVVFTTYYVFLIEVKNEQYSEVDYDEPLWQLANGDEVSNPMRQNHFHKLVFCSEMGIPREKVITIEVLLENGKWNNQSPYINDYIFDKNDLEKIKYLFITESSEKLDVELVFSKFEKLVSEYSISEQEHIEMLKRTEKIETRIRRTFGKNIFRRTDIIKCWCCDEGLLVFREYMEKQEVRSSKQYALGCTSYGNSSIDCSIGLIKCKAENLKRFRKMQPIAIDERNKWKEENMNSTVLDEVDELRRKCERLQMEKENQISKYNTIIAQKNKELETIKTRNNELEEIIEQRKNNEKQLEDTIRKFKRVIGNFFVYREK